jgi:non-ribosomal peptide synthetase component F
MSPYMLVGMIGAIKAGCGYVPIDTSVPSERVNMMLNIMSGCTLFIIIFTRSLGTEVSIGT